MKKILFWERLNRGFTPLEVNGAWQKYKGNKPLTGFALTEVIIVIIIFTIIAGVISSAIVYSQKSYAFGGNVAEIIQNSRVIIERMSREIRQAKKIITPLPEENINPSSEIKFQDGHLSEILEEDQAQGGNNNTITLSLNAQNKNDYYKDFFIKIISGSGSGQIRNITNYDGISKTAKVNQDWTIIPDITSFYKIDSSFYYIHYYRDANNNILRKTTTHCFSEDSLTCVSPETYVSCVATPPGGQTLLEIVLESPRIIGEYVSNLEFYGARVINIFMELNIKDQIMQLKTKVFGRNL